MNTFIPFTKEALEEAKKRTCPKVVLPGWWWKKHFKKYQALRVLMQNLTDHYWMNGGYEKEQELLKKMCDMTIDLTILNTYGKGFHTNL